MRPFSSAVIETPSASAPRHRTAGRATRDSSRQFLELEPARQQGSLADLRSRNQRPHQASIRTFVLLPGRPSQRSGSTPPWQPNRVALSSKQRLSVRLRVDAKHPVPRRDAGARSAICRANLAARRRVDDVRYPDHRRWRWRQHDRLQRRQRAVASAAAVRRPGTPGLGRERNVGEPVEAGRSSRTSRRSAAAEPVAGWPRRVFAVLWRRRHQADRHRRSGARHRCACDGGLLSAAGRTSLAGTRLHRRGMPAGAHQEQRS